MKKSSKVKDLSGKKFGRLSVLFYVGNDKFRCATWECRCDCGNYITVSRPNLVSGNTSSCGCLQEEAIRLPYGQSSLNKLLYSYKSNAKRRSISFDLSEREFLSLVVLDCFYCGKHPTKIFEIENIQNLNSLYDIPRLA